MSEQEPPCIEPGQGVLVYDKDRRTITARKEKFLPCPICNGVEGCDHTYLERREAAKAHG